MNDFLYAVTANDPEPELWPVAWTETLLRAVESGTVYDLKEEDPSSFYEHMREARVMCQRLRAAAEAARSASPPPAEPVPFPPVLRRGGLVWAATGKTGLRVRDGVLSHEYECVTDAGRRAWLTAGGAWEEE